VYENQHLFDEARPHLEAFDIEGDRLVTLFEDPFGMEVTPDVRTKAENVVLNERLQAMEREISILRAQRDTQERAEIAGEAEADTKPGPLPRESPTIPIPQAPPASDLPPRAREYDHTAYDDDDPVDERTHVTEDAPSRIVSKGGQVRKA
jgi:hypothetical protein